MACDVLKDSALLCSNPERRSPHSASKLASSTGFHEPATSCQTSVLARFHSDPSGEGCASENRIDQHDMMGCVPVSVNIASATQPHDGFRFVLNEVACSRTPTPAARSARSGGSAPRAAVAPCGACAGEHLLRLSMAPCISTLSCSSNMFYEGQTKRVLSTIPGKNFIAHFDPTSRYESDGPGSSVDDEARVAWMPRVRALHKLRHAGSPASSFRRL
jgi:hypothetical protein